MARDPVPMPSLDAVLVSEVCETDSVLEVRPNSHLGDVPLAVLIHHATTCPCTNIELPEEAPYGDDIDYF